MAGVALTGVESSYGAEKKPKYGGRLRIGERFNAAGLDAHKNQLFLEFQNYLLMYNGLTDLGQLPQINIYPDVAKSWEISKDGRDYIFLLREGVKFHHGKELDSNDVKYSIERVMNPATRSPMAFGFRMIESITAVDKYTVKIHLKTPFGPLLSALTIRNCPIIPAGWEPTPMKPAPGTGPFVFKSIDPLQTTEYTRFDQYWEIDENTGMRLPYLDGIWMKGVAEDIVRWTGLRAGDFDYINIVPRKIAVEEQKNPTPGIVVMITQPVGVAWIYMNCAKPPFDNKKVRHAIGYCIDKEEILKGAYYGLGEVCNNQPFLNRSRLFSPVQDRKMDRDKARQLLAEAGYPKGFKCEIPCSTESYSVDSCQCLRWTVEDDWDRSYGTGHRVGPTDGKIEKGRFHHLFPGDSERLDPDDAFYMRLHSSEIGQNNNSFYNNKEMDKLLEQGRSPWKWEDRKPVYQKVVELIKEDLPILYVAKAINPIGWRDYVKGHEGGLSTWFGYYHGGMKKVWLDK